MNEQLFKDTDELVKKAKQFFRATENLQYRHEANKVFDKIDSIIPEDNFDRTVKIIRDSLKALSVLLKKAHNKDLAHNARQLSTSFTEYLANAKPTIADATLQRLYTLQPSKNPDANFTLEELKSLFVVKGDPEFVSSVDKDMYVQGLQMAMEMSEWKKDYITFVLTSPNFYFEILPTAEVKKTFGLEVIYDPYKNKIILGHYPLTDSYYIRNSIIHEAYHGYQGNSYIHWLESGAQLGSFNSKEVTEQFQKQSAKCTENLAQFHKEIESGNIGVIPSTLTQKMAVPSGMSERPLILDNESYQELINQGCREGSVCTLFKNGVPTPYYITEIRKQPDNKIAVFIASNDIPGLFNLMPSFLQNNLALYPPKKHQIEIQAYREHVYPDIVIEKVCPRYRKKDKELLEEAWRRRQLWTQDQLAKVANQAAEIHRREILGGEVRYEHTTRISVKDPLHANKNYLANLKKFSSQLIAEIILGNIPIYYYLASGLFAFRYELIFAAASYFGGEDAVKTITSVTESAAYDTASTATNMTVRNIAPTRIGIFHDAVKGAKDAAKASYAKDRNISTAAKAAAFGIFNVGFSYVATTVTSIPQSSIAIYTSFKEGGFWDGLEVAVREIVPGADMVLREQDKALGEYDQHASTRLSRSYEV